MLARLSWTSPRASRASSTTSVTPQCFVTQFSTRYLF